MSTLAEIEAAVEMLPPPQQVELLRFLTGRIARRDVAMSEEDPFAAVVGAFAGPCDATGRKSEEILYGHGA